MERQGQAETSERRAEATTSGLFNARSPPTQGRTRKYRGSPITPPTMAAGDDKEVTSAQRRGKARGSPAKASRRSLRLRALQSCGDFSALPMELVEKILSNCDSRELAVLDSTCRFFHLSGVVQRIAAAKLFTEEHGLQIARMKPEGRDSLVRLLHFVRQCSSAEEQGRAISLGAFHSAVLVESPGGRNCVHTFGRGFHGQLGNGSYDSSKAPTLALLPSNEKAAMIRCGSSHCAVVTQNGDLYTWGLASSGELGHTGWTPIEVEVPRLVRSLAAAVRIVSVATGGNHTLAVGACGSVWACGRGRHGQLGLGHFRDAGSMTLCEALRGVRVMSAAAGQAHSLVMTDSGDVWAWGDARDGQLGFGSDAQYRAENPDWNGAIPFPCPTVLNSRKEAVVAVAAGGHHSIQLSVSGRVFVAGRNKHGALGTGDTNKRDTFTEVVLPFHSVHGAGCSPRAPRCACMLVGGSTRCVQVAAGSHHSLILTACGVVLSAGSNVYGQLGLGFRSGSTPRPLFTPVGLPGNAKASAIAAGSDHSAAVSYPDRKLFLWGRGDWGQLGDSGERARWAPVTLEKGPVVGPGKEPVIRPSWSAAGAATPSS